MRALRVWMVLFVLMVAALGADSPATDEVDERDPTALERIAKAAVQRVLTGLLEAETQVDGVRLDLKGQLLELRGLRIGNPRGFGDEPCIKADLVRLEADPKLLFSREPMLRLIKLQGAEINAEQNLSHGLNLLKMYNNVKDAKGLRLAQNNRQKWRIEKAMLEGCKMRLTTQLIGQKTYERTLEPMEMSFMGENGGGMATQQILMQALTRIMSEIQTPGLSNGSTDTQKEHPLTGLFEVITDL